MTTKPIRFFAFMSLAISAPVACGKPTYEMTEDLPSRTDCIVLAAYDSPDKAEPNSFTGLLAIARGIDVPLAGYTIREEGLYFQFGKQCDEKSELATRVLRELKKQRPSIEAHFRVSDEVINPSAETIDIRGNRWSD